MHDPVKTNSNNPNRNLDGWKTGNLMRELDINDCSYELILLEEKKLQKSGGKEPSQKEIRRLIKNSRDLCRKAVYRWGTYAPLLLAKDPKAALEGFDVAKTKPSGEAPPVAKPSSKTPQSPKLPCLNLFLFDSQNFLKTGSFLDSITDPIRSVLQFLHVINTFPPFCELK